ncbi:tetratricopeptide repeat protein [Streptomyces ipomoeae]|jgi:MinD-like ATPase involved in chromosome partitioning or flagellar assembly/tetratricopeptide (TPR) repeat protein|uniref:Tetratricopeptide repeat protein n=2 Tax=Streptomyces ipomoeae TaxID=103232 RepID=L1KQQ5_9ACTN|nr:FxSxx-COOH system tetratricopeptide repeat protein [Streptomyces ipomoeae]EKX62713.1 tetratricopeptide repeat protein [Streptomyces ipomoeae 91-03]MDX2694534.1 FxSxx-COOH system tetratricopeptide repeat protein [Streptomyces ipomoeae]MDX2822385.1 FxSxx-COOH system tetratricopeptide repeat protein [Streptomyces ipomoeae]MDX2840115.1 FxSxx-COOH system tetratricopeptide repeat protein [Streptomyces ipomoeae]MDX2878845.1 FxSxx-COOH system tetratricopeptide repeat protein [Streptomyces ipomoeae]
MTGEDARRIITFYSYKGGTGRTMALANTGWILASSGKSVLVVDWDLDAPGLDRFLHPFLSESQLRTTPGVLDLVSRSMPQTPSITESGRQMELGSDSSATLDAWTADSISLNSCLIQVDWDFPSGGQLYYLPAGTKNKGYLAAFSQFDWKPFMDGPLATRFLEGLKREFVENFDYVLIDSRTGLNDISDICTVSLPHTLVTCFTPSSQSIEGAAGVAERIDGMYGNRDIRILPVPMRVENAEADRLDAARGQIQYRFDRVVRKHVPDGDPEDYWRSVEIPYVPIYSYEETLAPFRELPGDPKSLLAAYERLTAVITDGQVESMPRIDEPLRRKTLDRYTRHRPPRISDVYVSFVPQDRSWANWAGSVLEQAGFKVHLAQEGTAEGAQLRDEIERGVESASHTLVIFSEAYLRSSRFRTTWEAVYAEGDRRAHQLISMQVDRTVSLDAPFTELLADMTRCDTGEVGREALLSCFGPTTEAATGNHFTGGEQKLPRYPGAEPPVFSVPLRTSSFTGRTELLETIREKLWNEENRALVLKGMGGVGKTLLAQEFAYRYKSDYDVIWHIQAEQPDLVTEQYASMAEPLGLPMRTNPTDTAKAVYEALDRGEPYSSWLLILDNVTEAEKLPEFMLDGRGGHILITSQRAEGWGRFVDTVDVPVFERDESIAHLHSRLPDCGWTEADQIAEALGDLPIAIERAAAYIEQTRVDVRSYIQQLQPHATGAPADNTVGEVVKSSTHTWEFALGQLREKFPPAVQLLQICSYYSPEPISMDLLEGFEVSRALGGVRTVSRSYKELSKFSLVTVDRKARSVTVHRMMQVAMREEMTEAEREAAQEVVYRSLVAARPSGDDPENPNNWEKYRIIWPHLGTPWAETSPDEGIKELFVDRVRQLRRRGELTQAMDYGARRVAAWSADGAPDERWTLHMRFQIANILRAQGRYEESLALDQEVLERQLAVLDDVDDQHILMTTSSIAADLRGLGRLSEALRYDEETYERYEQIYGEDHARTLSAANNLAVALRLSGDYHRARDLDRRTLELREAIQLHDHPLTIESAVNLGRDLRDCGDYEESVTLLKRAYDRCLRNPRLTQGSPTVLNTAKGLAGSLRRAGRPAEAEELVRHVLRSTPDGEKQSSSEQLLLEMSLAGDMAAQGRVDEGLKLIRRVQEDLRDSLGEGHSQTVACSVNYAVLLLHDVVAISPEMAAEAQELLRQAEERFSKLNGEHHPYVLICRANLAVAEAALDKWEDARRTSFAAYELLKEVLEPLHPSTLTCAGNLAVILSRLGRADEARTKHHDTLAALSKRVGREHPRVLALQAWELSCLDLEPHPI